MRSLLVLVVILMSQSFAVDGQVGPGGSNQNITQLAQLVEQTRLEVARIAQRAQEIYDNQCSTFASCNASRSMFQCSNIPITDLQCINSAPNAPFQVLCNASRPCSNLLLGFDAPMIQLSPGLSVQINTGQIRQGLSLSLSVCQHAGLTDVYKQLINASNISPASPFANWRYFANPFGVMSTYPFQWDRQIHFADVGAVACDSEFEPRLRPWYTGAITETKVVAIVIDVGSSTKASASSGNNYDTETKLLVAQTAARALINALRVNDAVTVITFSDATDVEILPETMGDTTSPDVPDPTRNDTTVPLRNPIKINRADLSEVAYLLNSIDSLTSRTGGDSTGLEKAISVALKLIGKAAGLDACQKNIVVMSPGISFGDINGTAARIAVNLLNATQPNAQNQAITPFFFSVGDSNSNGDRLFKMVACHASGVWGRIDSATNVLRFLYPYFNFLAQTSSVYNRSYYSGEYSDALGLGRVFTLSQPVFSKITGDFIGVAGGDTSYTLTSNNFNTGTVKDYFTPLINKQLECTNVKYYDKCLIPAIRAGSVNCSEFNLFGIPPVACNLTSAPNCTAPLPSSALYPPGVSNASIASMRCCETCGA